MKRFALEEFANKRTRREKLELAASFTGVAVGFAPYIYKVIEYVVNHWEAISLAGHGLFRNYQLMVTNDPNDQDFLASFMLTWGKLNEPLSSEDGQVLLMTFNLWFEQLPEGMQKQTQEHFGAEWIEKLRQGKVALFRSSGTSRGSGLRSCDLV